MTRVLNRIAERRDGSVIYFSMDDELVRLDEESGRSEVILKGLQVVSFASDPSDTKRLYCGTYGHGLWRSVDAGDNWEPVGVPHVRMPVQDDVIHSPHILSLTVSAKQSEKGYSFVYAGTEPSAIYYSDDGGDTWHEYKDIQTLPSKPIWSYPPRPHTSHVRWLETSPNDPEQLFVAIEFGAFLRSLDGGNHWEDRKFNGPVDTHTFALHEKAPGRIYAATGDGFFQAGRGYAESTDAGATWKHPNEGLRNHYLYTLAVDSGNPDIVLVGAADAPWYAHVPSRANSTIYRKEGEAPWEEVTAGLPRPEGMLISTLTAHPDQAGVFYALNNHGLFRSDDTGRTWRNMDIPWKETYQTEHPNVLVCVPWSCKNK